MEKLQGGTPVILHIKVCLQVLGSATAYGKKVFCGSEGAVRNLMNWLKCYHLSQRQLGLKSLKMKKKSVGVELE